MKSCKCKKTLCHDLHMCAVKRVSEVLFGLLNKRLELRLQKLKMRLFMQLTARYRAKMSRPCLCFC